LDWLIPPKQGIADREAPHVLAHEITSSISVILQGRRDEYSERMERVGRAKHGNQSLWRLVVRWVAGRRFAIRESRKYGSQGCAEFLVKGWNVDTLLTRHACLLMRASVSLHGGFSTLNDIWHGLEPIIACDQ